MRMESGRVSGPEVREPRGRKDCTEHKGFEQGWSPGSVHRYRDDLTRRGRTGTEGQRRNSDEPVRWIGVGAAGE